MSVPSNQLEVTYAGNESIVTAYPIPFPFFDPAHIFAAVKTVADEAAVLLDASGFNVVPTGDGSGGSLYTTAAVDDTSTITIFRELPLTQPTVFQVGGPFPAKTAETALDRLLMQIQQVNRRLNALDVDEDAITAVASMAPATWLSATERAALKPSYAGQLGVERATRTIWTGQSTAVGDWTEFQPRHSETLVLCLVSDAGVTGGEALRTTINERLIEFDPDAVIFAGDNTTGPAADYTADWSQFAAWITAGKAYPALGAKDLDYVGWESRHVAKFGYLPGNKRYYTVSLGAGLVDLFVLNSGVDSLFALQEPDGNDVNSAQHAWFVAAAAASTARWKIAVFHRPPATSRVNPGGSVLAAMRWPELRQMDLICCGQRLGGLFEILRWNETMVFSATANYTAVSTPTVLTSSEYESDRLVWALGVTDTGALGRIIASENRLEVEVIEKEAGGLLHSRSVTDFTGNSPIGSGGLTMSAARLLGRTSGTGTGTPAEISIGSGLTLVANVLAASGGGDMLKSVYDSQDAGYISGLNNSGQGGYLSMDGGFAFGVNGGWVFTYGGDDAGAHGGSFVAYGGSLPGGSVTTANGGGAINTTGTGSLQLGYLGTRTTLTGAATTDRAISLPDRDGVLALARRVVSVAYAATVTPDADTTDFLKIDVLTGNLTLATPGGTPADGQKIEVELLQDGTGGRTLTLGSGFIFPAGSDLSSPINAADFIAANSLTTALIEWSATRSKWKLLSFVTGC